MWNWRRLQNESEVQTECVSPDRVIGSIRHRFKSIAKPRFKSSLSTILREIRSESGTGVNVLSAIFFKLKMLHFFRWSMDGCCCPNEEIR